VIRSLHGGGWAILQFHGVGGGYMDCSLPDFRQFVSWIADEHADQTVTILQGAKRMIGDQIQSAPPQQPVNSQSRWTWPMPEIISDLLSTIIPVYNRPQMLREAVQSMLDQTYRPIEIIRPPNEEIAFQ
jgi:hypothetical protein